MTSPAAPTMPLLPFPPNKRAGNEHSIPEPTKADPPKKNKWNMIRERISAAASPMEVRLVAKVGQSLVDRFGPFCPPRHAPKSARELLLTHKCPSLVNHQMAFLGIKESWEEEAALRKIAQPWSDTLMYQTAVFCDFGLEESVELLRRMLPNQWNATATQLQDELQKTRAVFPLPRLTTKAAQSVMYLCPARFNEARIQSDPLRLLTHVMQTIYQRYSDPSQCKLALVIDMQGYRLKCNRDGRGPIFGQSEWLSLMDLLQGHDGPVKVQQVLIVKAPPAFHQVWQRMRSMVRDRKFVWRFSFVPTVDELPKYFTTLEMAQYLPQDLHGEEDAANIVKDFCKYRLAVDEIVAEKNQTQKPKEIASLETKMKNKHDTQTKAARDNDESSLGRRLPRRTCSDGVRRLSRGNSSRSLISERGTLSSNPRRQFQRTSTKDSPETSCRNNKECSEPHNTSRKNTSADAQDKQAPLDGQFQAMKGARSTISTSEISKGSLRGHRARNSLRGHKARVRSY